MMPKQNRIEHGKARQRPLRRAAPVRHQSPLAPAAVVVYSALPRVGTAEQVVVEHWRAIGAAAAAQNHHFDQHASAMRGLSGGAKAMNSE